MPSLKIHCAISKKRTGKKYEELHKWIDDNKEHKSVNHRTKNHHYTTKIKNYVSKEFGKDNGPEAVSEWLFHIALDNLSTCFKNDSKYLKNERNFYKIGFEGGYVHYAEGKIKFRKVGRQNQWWLKKKHEKEF